MGLDAVVDEILAQGKQEQEGILRKADEEADAIRQDAERKAKEVRQKRQREAEQRKQALEREILGASEFEARRSYLSVQRELLTDFRRRVLETLSQLPQDRNTAILKKLVADAKKELPAGRVHGRKQDLDFLVDQGFEKGDAIGCAGGFLLEGAGGEVQLDYRFETLVDDEWKQILVKTRDLFEVE